MTYLTISIIPAREGSTRLPSKNFIPFLNNKSLAQIALEFSREINVIDYTLLDTTSLPFKAEMNSLDLVDFDYVRDTCLSLSTTTTCESSRALLRAFESTIHEKITSIVLLQPTSPFRDKKQLLNAINKVNHGFTPLQVSATYSPIEPADCFHFSADESQSLLSYHPPSNVQGRPMFISGSFYVLSRDHFLSSKEPFTPKSEEHVCLTALETFYDIDYKDQFQLAQNAIK